MYSFPERDFAVTHLQIWVDRGTMRVECLAQKHHTTFLARDLTWTTSSRGKQKKKKKSRGKHTNREATTPPQKNRKQKKVFLRWSSITE